MEWLTTPLSLLAAVVFGVMLARAVSRKGC